MVKKAKKTKKSTSKPDFENVKVNSHKKHLEELHSHFKDYAENYLKLHKLNATINKKKMKSKHHKHVEKIANHLDSIHKLLVEA
jgi:deoxyadenosine/deoxycytidine kinase